MGKLLWAGRFLVPETPLLVAQDRDVDHTKSERHQKPMAVNLRASIDMLLSSEFWRMAIRWTLSLLYSRLLLLFRPSPSFPRRRRRLSPDPDSRIERPICVVTGATSGLGAAAARALSGEGYHVVLVGRCPQLLNKMMQGIKHQDKDAYLDAFVVDLSSIRSIVKFESSFKQWLTDSNLHPSVQLLINNAGIFAVSHRVTADGYDKMVETNYIGAFVLTNLLLPLLKNSPVPSRIVNVTSFTHRSVSDIEVDRENLSCLPTSGKYRCAHIYEYSKLCLLLFTYELHRQFYAKDLSADISVNSADPGAVETNIMRELPGCLSQLAFTVLRLLCLLQSPEEGVASVVDAALAPEEVSGKYFFGGKGRTIRSSLLSYDARLATDLWSTSHMLLQESLLSQGGQ
ncbi:dehydrogenase/reductase SDR family member on chromosome X-like isoform X1 [Iris pallida]|uniref:Dehydrogenase/reductase SDR family member on chromosome X-like isoform X1 n=1 Tax=Iris pallida TaxID=29817 RepID=A0AAX6F633_IRIPA|nr:dehydrogenase/reductase SDR family member on chromosome X-like isoform X1 [Iris pallida]